MATSQRFRMTRTTSALAGTAVLAAVLVTVASALPASAAKPGSGSTTGTGQVFKVNPVQSSGDQSLTDMKDSDAAVPMSEYASVQLRNLDGSGYLRGTWANVQSSTGTPAFSTTNPRGTCPFKESATPITAHSATAGCPASTSSIVPVDNRWPATLITSSIRPITKR